MEKVISKKQKEKIHKAIKNTFWLLVFGFWIFTPDLVAAYSLGEPADSLNRIPAIFNQNPLQFSPIDLNKFTSSDRSGITFTDLTNNQSFSTQDIGSSIKAVLILFIKLMVTTLNVTLGIFKALLGVLTSIP